MHDAVEDFVEDLRRSKFAPVADQIEAVLRATDLEADYNLGCPGIFRGRDLDCWSYRPHSRGTVRRAG